MAAGLVWVLVWVLVLAKSKVYGSFSNYACHPCALQEGVEPEGLGQHTSSLFLRARRLLVFKGFDVRGHANLLCIVPSLTDAPEGVQS